jgi:hypothetical protein
VHPTACLKAYNFITDQDFTDVLSSTLVNVKNGSIKSTSPGQFSNNVLIANTCASDMLVDLTISLDPRWETHGANAVHTYSTAGEIDPATFNIAAFGAGTPGGVNLCLQNVSIPAGTTFLAAVHSQLNKSIGAANLGDAPFQFSASLLQPNASCAGPLETYATPNPVSTALPFTTY